MTGNTNGFLSPTTPNEHVIYTAIPLVLRLHTEIVESQIVDHTCQIGQREDLQQVHADRIEPVGGYLVAGERIARVGDGVVGVGIVNRALAGEVAGPHGRGRLAVNRRRR